jgi:phosphoenolpyruvate-protein phosphotransferase/dihydroxyacetone kinase phosphotransfer subunit
MVGIVIVSHSSKLAQGVVELARGMGGPDVPLRAVGGLDLPDSPLGTDANLILQAIQEVYSDDGVVVLMDQGSAILSAELALEMLLPDQREHVWLCEAPLVEGAVAAAVQARLGSPVVQVLAEARGALQAKTAQLRAETPALLETQPEGPTTQSVSQAELFLTIQNQLGLHARPAARFVKTAASFPNTLITVQNVTTSSAAVNGKSINSLATLGVRQGHTLRVTAAGVEMQAALAALHRLAEQNFGDEPTGIASLLPSETSTDQTTAKDQPTPNMGEPVGVLKGLAISPGIVQGPARWVKLEFAQPLTTRAVDPAAEWQALQIALEQTRTQIQATRQAVMQRAGAYNAAIFEAHLLFLDDPTLLEPARSAILDNHLNAAAAWFEAVKKVAARYRRLEDEYLRLRLADLESVGQQVLQNLPGHTPPAPLLSQPGILVASDLSPADTARLDPEMALGLCTALGGPTSHSAILARSLGIPAIAGLGEAILQVDEGTPLLMDGGSGQVWLDPDPVIMAEYAGRMAAAAALSAAARELSASPAVTRDGRRIEASANIGSLADARLAVACGAESVGLFRSEFLFLNRPQAPDEDEQYAAYRQVAETLAGRPLVIRTLDAGGDKPLPYLDLEPEANPFLGGRAIRLCLSRPDFFKLQLRAILRLAAEFPVKVMFPLIATLDEWRQACNLLAEARHELLQRSQVAPKRIQTGIMVETPAAALCIERFTTEVDFFSIGSNDLTQYTLAAERGNPRLAQLSDPLQPAVLLLIQQVIASVHKHGKRVSVCGEMAADPPAAALLVGLGVDELSVNPVALPQVKQLIRQLEYQAMRHLAQSAVNLESPDAVRAAIHEYTGTPARGG